VCRVSPGVKRPVRGFDRPLPTIAGIANGLELSLLRPPNLFLYRHVIGWIFIQLWQRER